MNIADVLVELARSRPHHPAIEDGERIISYAELDARVNAAVHRLSAAGVQLGDFVGVELPDRLEHLVLVLALFRLGAVVVSVAEGLSEADRQKAVANLDVQHMIVADPRPALQGTEALLLGRLCDETFADAPVFDAPVLPPGHPAIVRQSSGTTGVPKSVVWSHDLFVGRLSWQQDQYGWSATDRYMQVVPMSFSYSRDHCITLLQFGGTIVINQTQTLVDLALAIRDRKITCIALTPAHVRALLRLDSDSWPLFPQLRGVFSTSSALTAAERQQAQERITPNLFDGYGTNEVGLITLAGPQHRAAQPDSVGPAVAGVEVRVVDKEGVSLPPGEVGLICMRSPGMPTGYHRDPEATARHFRDGWFYPGDLGLLNEAGYLFFKGRADDVINNQGVKFYPLEVEQVLREHPDVEEVAVFGWPHRMMGEVAVACVVAAEPLDLVAAHDFCKPRLAGHKLPVALYTLKELPKTSTGKVRKQALKDLLRERLDRKLVYGRRS